MRGPLAGLLCRHGGRSGGGGKANTVKRLAFEDFVSNVDKESLNRTRMRRLHIHRELVGLDDGDDIVLTNSGTDGTEEVAHGTEDIVGERETPAGCVEGGRRGVLSRSEPSSCRVLRRTWRRCQPRG